MVLAVGIVAGSVVAAAAIVAAVLGTLRALVRWFGNRAERRRARARYNVEYSVLVGRAAAGARYDPVVGDRVAACVRLGRLR